MKNTESDGKIDSWKFADKIFRNVGAILIDKLKHSVIDYWKETGISFKGVWEKYDVKKTGILDIPNFERLMDEYRMNLNQTMRRHLIILVDVNMKKEISYHYLNRIFNLENLDDAKWTSAILASGS